MTAILLARARVRFTLSGLSHSRPRFQAPPALPKAPARSLRRNNSTTQAAAPEPPLPQPATPAYSYRRSMSILMTTAKICFALHLIASHLVMISPCTGASMLPTFPAEMHWVLVSRLHKLGWSVEVGDIVSLQHPMFPGQLAAKRVVGMPGDYIVVDPLEERKVMLQVPPGHCYVMGDNLSHSRDSRHYGPVPLGLLEGKVVARLGWPPEVIRRPLEVVN